MTISRSLPAIHARHQMQSQRPLSTPSTANGGALGKPLGVPACPPGSFAWLGLCCALFAGCAGSQQAVTSAEPNQEDERDDWDSTAHIGATAEIGAMPEEESIEAFRNSFGEIQRCFISGAGRIDFIGGQISLQVWVGSDGEVQTVYADQSTLGDRQTEECMFNALRGASWPAPVGGPIAVAQNAFEFEMTGDVRPPVPWEEDQVADVLAEKRGQIMECKQGGTEKFLATAYVDTDGSAMSVGIAAPSRQDEANSECLVNLLSAATYPSPGSWPAKVSFYL
jgi:hypothetical protein